MSDTNVRIGIDYRDGLFYVARVDHRSGRPEVKALVRFERDHFGAHALLEGGTTVFSVADDIVVAKRVAISDNGRDANLKVRFELSQAILEDESLFYFDVLPTARTGCYLGLMIRKERLLADFANLLNRQQSTLGEAQHLIRAAALARGYIGFCRQTGGELICLADFNGSLLSLALMYREQVIDLTYMDLGKFDLVAAPGLEKMAIDLKTVINYRISMLFAEGITVPLSALLIAGDRANQDTVKTLRRFFSIDTELPKVNPGFFSNPQALAEIPLEKYLVALGLAVK